LNFWQKIMFKLFKEILGVVVGLEKHHKCSYILKSNKRGGIRIVIRITNW
jgi:hypothetical protein